MSFIIKNKSNKKLLNKRGPKTDPWGIPNKISSHELYGEFICGLSNNLNPYAFNFAIKRSCERQSNVLESTERSPPNLFDYQLAISISQALTEDTAGR